MVLKNHSYILKITKTIFFKINITYFLQRFFKFYFIDLFLYSFIVIIEAFNFYKITDCWKLLARLANRKSPYYLKPCIKCPMKTDNLWLHNFQNTKIKLIKYFYFYRNSVILFFSFTLLTQFFNSCVSKIISKKWSCRMPVAPPKRRCKRKTAKCR